MWLKRKGKGLATVKEECNNENVKYEIKNLVKGKGKKSFWLGTQFFSNEIFKKKKEPHCFRILHDRNEWVHGLHIITLIS